MNCIPPLPTMTLLNPKSLLPPIMQPTTTAVANIVDEAEAFKQDYFEKAQGLSISHNLRVLKNVAQNENDALKFLMLLEDKKVYVDRNYSALVRPSRSDLRNKMKQAVKDFRQFSVATASEFQYQMELQLFWEALERKMTFHMQAEVKKKNVTISLGHLRPQTMRLLEFNAPVPVSSKFSDKSTKIYGSNFKYQLYTLVFKFNNSKSDGFGIPSDGNKQNKWFLVKYQTDKKRWYFVNVQSICLNNEKKLYFKL